MLLLLLIAILVGPIFSARCPSSCHCTRKAVLCVKSKKLNSLPDFSHTRFTVFYLQNSTLRSIKCTNLPDFVEILDIRNTWMKKQETCSLKNCPGKTIASLISSENCSNGTCKKQKTIHTFVSWLAYYYEGITTVREGGGRTTNASIPSIQEKRTQRISDAKRKESIIISKISRTTTPRTSTQAATTVVRNGTLQWWIMRA